ncbi:MAG: hypothetical protein D6719_13880, partial [Candidatus Dadabacteria bacterium]
MIVYLFTIASQALAIEEEPLYPDCNQNTIPDQCDIDPQSDPNLCGQYPLLNDSVQPADDCADAQEIQPGFFYTGSTVNMTNDITPGTAASYCGYPVYYLGPQAWYKYTAPADGQVFMTLGGTMNMDDGFDGILAVTRSCPADVSEIDVCNDDHCEGTPGAHSYDSGVSVTVTAGNTYYFMVGGFGGASGNFRMYFGEGQLPSSNECPVNAAGGSADCNSNSTPDECDIADGSASDCNNNSRPDQCESQMDCDGNGNPDICDFRLDVVFDNDDNHNNFDFFGISGPLKESNYQTIFDVLGDNYSSEITEPTEDPDEDYMGPAFECAAGPCPDLKSDPPFGIFLDAATAGFTSGDLSTGGVYQSQGTYHTFRTTQQGNETQGALGNIDGESCGLAVPDTTGFWAELTPDGSGGGTFNACFHPNTSSQGWFAQSYAVSGKYDSSGRFVGKGQKSGGGPRNWDVYLAGRFAVPMECQDCNGNLIGDKAEIEQGLVEDKDGNGVPDECEGCGEDGSRCGCIQSDYSALIGNMTITAKSQRRSMKQIMRRFRGKWGCGRANANQAYRKLTLTVNSLPVMVTTCEPNPFCTDSVVNQEAVTDYIQSAQRVYQYSRCVLRKWWKSTRGGKCNGLRCKKRVRRRRILRRKYLRQITETL